LFHLCFYFVSTARTPVINYHHAYKRPTSYGGFFQLQEVQSFTVIVCDFVLANLSFIAHVCTAWPVGMAAAPTPRQAVSSR